MPAGRKPDPDYVRILKGKKPRAKPHELIVHTPGIPRAPAFLDTRARKAWNEMCTELKTAGLLFNISGAALARYCMAWSEYEGIRLAQLELGERRYKITDANYRQHSVWIKMLKEAESVMRNFELEYGLTPSSSTKLRKPPGVGEPIPVTPEQQLESFLQEGKPS